MKFFLRIMAIVGVLLLVLAVVFISMALVLGFAMGIGWLLTLFLPFDLFQASLLAIIAAVIAVVFWRTFLSSVLPFGLGEDEYDEEDEYDYVDDDFNRIPESRFFKKNADKTWEAWLQYHIANSIYIEFQDSDQPVAPMGEKQLQELAIRLADITISLLKTKSSRAKQLKVTIAVLKRQMNKMGQRPYDENILRLATTAINDELDYHYEDVIMVIRSKLWNEFYDGKFDWE